ncbi:hypothetical protein [Pseudomonas phage Astolliot]|nr:hypothetical protein [Pseudomonas phage Astolliot]
MTYESFVSFVMAQPADRVIDHTSWQSCAIGDYVASDDQEQDRETESFMDLTDSVGEILMETNPTLYEILNCHGEVWPDPIKDDDDEFKTIETYGDLQAYLNGTF